MLKIGFATEYYTLWDLHDEEVYFTDSYGNHHLQRVKTHCNFIKNISIDLDKVKLLHPDLSIDESLRGKSGTFFRENKEEDLSPEILKFGKHSGKSISHIAEIDFNYILWLLENSSKVIREICEKFPKVIEHFKNVKEENDALMNSYPVVNNGEIELNFESNPNRTGEILDYINQNSRILANIPKTLIWKDVKEWNKQGDLFTICIANEGEWNQYKIQHYKNSTKFSTINGNFETIEEAKLECEKQELTNKHELKNYYIPTELAKYEKMHYAIASQGEGHEMYVFIENTKSVEGMYPYNMAILKDAKGKDKAMKLKNKKIKLNIEVFHTIKSVHGVTQYAKIV